MADRNITERLQPSLLDRLTDLEPEKKTESRDARVIDVHRLRDIIRRDLSWLLNALNLDNVIDGDAFPRVHNSVLNYGLRDVSGEFSSETRALELRKAMYEAIRRFEPRINEGTLDVALHQETKDRKAVVIFDITADMWAEPIALSLYLRSEVDITSGEVALKEQG